MTIPALCKSGELFCLLAATKGKVAKVGVRLSQQEMLERQRMAAQGLHWCASCKEFRPADEFNNHKNGRFGKHHYCKVCHGVKRDKNKQKQTINRRNRYLVTYYIGLAGGKCHKCSYCEFIAALDFHHVNRSEKQYNPTYVIISNNHDLAMAELDKCVLLCANCHRAYEAGYWKAEFIKRDGLGWTIKRGSIIETEFDNYDDLPDKYRYSQMSLI